MVNTRPPVITPAMIEDLKKQTNPRTGRPFNQADIAEIFGVTRQYISKVKFQTTDFSQTPREVAMESFPWKSVPAEFQRSALNKRLRDHAEYVATGGDGMTRYKLDRLRSFYKKLQDEGLVVEFDPEIPPHDGNKHGGYAYRQRLETDGELIIRVNQLAEMTPTAYVVWRYPEELP